MSGLPATRTGPSDGLQATLLVVALTAIVGVTAMGKALLTFLIGSAVLAPGSTDVLVEIPRADGAGLDTPRCWIALALAMTAIGVGVKHQHHRRRSEGE